MKICYTPLTKQKCRSLVYIMQLRQHFKVLRYLVDPELDPIHLPDSKSLKSIAFIIHLPRFTQSIISLTAYH